MFSFTFKELEKDTSGIIGMFTGKLTGRKVLTELKRGINAIEFNFKNNGYTIMRGENGYYTLAKIPKKEGYIVMDNFEDFDEAMIYINTHNLEKWYTNPNTRKPIIFEYEGPRDIKNYPERKLLIPEKLTPQNKKPKIL